jgi:hypothetical protein
MEEQDDLPLERHIDDLTACDGVKFWMSDGERPVLCRVSHEALRDLANRPAAHGLTAPVNLSSIVTLSLTYGRKVQGA